MLPSSLRCVHYTSLAKFTQFFNIQPKHHLLQEAFHNFSAVRDFSLFVTLQPFSLLSGQLEIITLWQQYKQQISKQYFLTKSLNLGRSWCLHEHPGHLGPIFQLAKFPLRADILLGNAGICGASGKQVAAAAVMRRQRFSEAPIRKQVKFWVLAKTQSALWDEGVARQ